MRRSAAKVDSDTQEYIKSVECEEWRVEFISRVKSEEWRVEFFSRVESEV